MIEPYGNEEINKAFLLRITNLNLDDADTFIIANTFNSVVKKYLNQIKNDEIFKIALTTEKYEKLLNNKDAIKPIIVAYTFAERVDSVKKAEFLLLTATDNQLLESEVQHYIFALNKIIELQDEAMLRNVMFIATNDDLIKTNLNQYIYAINSYINLKNKNNNYVLYKFLTNKILINEIDKYKFIADKISRTEFTLNDDIKQYVLKDINIFEDNYASQIEQKLNVLSKTKKDN